MELTYTKVGDYYIPDLTLGGSTGQTSRETLIKEHGSEIYSHN